MELQELLWFVGVTVGLHAAVVGSLNAFLELIERYGLFEEAKIQRGPPKVSNFCWRAVLLMLEFVR